MLRAVADTHTVIWYLYDDPRLSESARTLIEEAASAGDQIGFSTITLAEVVYLSEKGRIQPEALGRVLAALDEPGTVLQELPFDRAVVSAMPTVDRSEVPDLPDRIIASTAQFYQVALISRDRRIRLSAVETIW
jgi:PIN domain nuclease of toxin-antitoxin system